MAGFLFGAGTGDTATSLKRKRELIEELQNQIMGSPPKTTAEGIAALMKGAAAGIGKYRADKIEGEKTGAASSIYNQIMGDYSSKFPSPEAAGQVSATAPAPSNAQASSGATNYRDAIASIESKGSGDYNAVGPTHPKMGRALGRYQVMEANIGPWSQEALGRAVTPEEFMANPQIQDAIFDKKFGGYVEKFGPEGAAQAWFGGPGGVGKTDRKDSLGTSIGAYGDKFNKAMGGNQVASLNPQAAFGAVLADPSQISPEDTQRLQAMRGPTGGNTPYSGPGAKIDTLMPVYDTNGLHMPQQGGSLTDEVAQFQQSPEYAAQFPGQQPQQAMPQPVQQQPAQQVAQAQPQPMPQAIHPNGVDPRILQALSDPFLPEEQRSALQILAKQQMERSDPLRQLQLQEQQLKLRAMQNPQPEYDFINGKDGSVFRADKRAGTMEQLYGGKPDQPADVQEYEYYVQSEKAAGRQPLGPLEYQQALRRSGANNTSVNIDQKAEGAFDKKLAEKQAETFDVMAAEGINSRADLGVINELDTLLQGQGGTLTGLSGALAKYGIGGEGVDDLQAAQALINKLIPSQRAPGSGSMSDRDVEMFTRSLPSLWNSPGGNAKIVNVMRGLATYKQQQGEIADQVITGDMSRQEARRALRDLPNPLADMKPADATNTPGPMETGGTNATPDFSTMTDEELRRYIDGQ